jgi:hypothetical protein
MKCKHLLKYTLFLLLACLLLIPFKEGFSIPSIPGAPGLYDYLAPHPVTVLDATIEANFTTAFNTTNAAYNLLAPLQPTILNALKVMATLDEFNYYIANNKWPYGSYLTTYLTQNPSYLAPLSVYFASKLPTADITQSGLPSRWVYAVVLNGKESALTPKPLSNEIYMGTKPADATDATDATATTATAVVPVLSTSSLSADNYQKLASLCADVK